MKGAVQSVEVSYLLHATEDESKVREAVSGLFGFRSSPETEEMEGHFGNRITRVRYHATGEEAPFVFDRLLGSFPQNVRDEVGRNLVDLVDAHSALYLRLDKQSLVGGKVVLSSGDSIRVKVKPRLFALRGTAHEFYRSAFRK